LFLLATTVPVFLLASLLTRKAIWGHLATLLVLQGVLLEFDGSYPTAVWPDLYSNGHIGGAFALLTLYFIVAGHLRTAAFLFGAMPAIHIGQWPVLLGLVPLYVLWRCYRKEGALVRQAVPYFVGGLLVAISVYGIHMALREPVPTEGVYAATGDATAIWQGYTARHDQHRQFPPGNGQVILIGTLLLSAMLVTRSKDGVIRAAAGWIGVYAGGVAMAVWGVMAVHAVMGADIPFLLIAWMPYRLINHIPALFIALCLGALLNERKDGEGVPKNYAGGWLLVALLVGAAQPLLARIIPDELYASYVAQGDWVPFFLFGIAFATGFGRAEGVSSKFVDGLSFYLLFEVAFWVLVLPLGAFHQFGFACLILGFVLQLVLLRKGAYQKLGVFVSQRVLASAALVVCGVMLYHQWICRESLPKGTFTERVSTYLAEADQPDAMLLARPDEYMLQARTGHPVLVEAATPSLISYIPKLGPAIEKTYEDIYGMRFQKAGETKIPWSNLWRERSREEWESLGTRYGFDYVIAGRGTELNLDALLADEHLTLYAVNE
jgi:hypothetical protein